MGDFRLSALNNYDFGYLNDDERFEELDTYDVMYSGRPNFEDSTAGDPPEEWAEEISFSVPQPRLLSVPNLRVHLETPWQDGKHYYYALAAFEDSIARGEAPFASHLLYTQVLNDADPEERAQGMKLGDAWRDVSDLVVFYVDHGWTDGMIEGLDKATFSGKPIQIRRLP